MSNRRNETLFPGICRHAKTLGTNRTHLWFVLKGQRKSKDILTRYKQLLKKEGRTIPHELAKRAA